jgi:uncharacterized spore protein YtfJ
MVLRLPRATFVWNRSLAVTVVCDGVGQRVQLRRPIAQGELHMPNTVCGNMPTADVEQEAGAVLDKVLAAAQPGVVFSAPVVSGPYTIITASEVFAGGGYGFSGGAGHVQQTEGAKRDRTEPGSASGSGGGGGGGSRSRPVAAVIIGPDGVKVQPIADATTVAIAVMAAVGGMLFMRMRGRGRREARHRAR